MPLRQSIEDERWIEVSLSLGNIPEKLLSKAKKEIQRLGEKLDWEGSLEKTDTHYRLSIVPKTAGKLSPLELAQLSDALIEAVEAVANRFPELVSTKGYLAVENAPDNASPSQLKKREMAKLFQDVLTLKFPISKRIMLEDKNFHLANMIFRSSLYFDFRKKSNLRLLYHKINKKAERQDRQFIARMLREMSGLTND